MARNCTLCGENLYISSGGKLYTLFYRLQLCTTECNLTILQEALMNTAVKRGSRNILGEHKIIMTEIKNSPNLKEFWRRYQGEFAYATNISYDDACQSIEEILNKILS